jgi:ribose/xylose/arabinose/galactoside ABC-type transport system permease subunit
MQTQEAQSRLKMALDGIKAKPLVKGAIDFLDQTPEWRLILAILIGGGLLAAFSDAFLTPFNLRSVLLAFSFTAIAALGQLLVIITAGIDLSAGSVIGLSGMIAAFVIVAGFHPVVGMLVGVLAGVLIGLINGFFFVRFKIHSFIITLGTMQIARGITVGLNKGDTITGFPESFLAFGNDNFVGLPPPVWMMLALVVIFSFILFYTKLGRELLAIGGNAGAARLAGVPVSRNLLIAYTTSGAMAALSGVLLIARLGAAVSNAGVGAELNIIASVVIGGASLSGGKGTALGVMLGALLIGLVNNALVLLAVPTYWQQTFIGSIIVAAALIDRLRR